MAKTSPPATEMPPATHRDVALILLPNFSMMAVAALIEPLRLANRALGRGYYRWQTYGPTAPSVTASNGLAIPADASIDQLTRADVVLVCAGIGVAQLALPSKVGARLRSLAAKGARMGGVCTGTYVLAQFGLLGERRCTIHWEELDPLLERHPHLNVTRHLFEFDGTIMTCAGGTASLDMMLHYLGREHGFELADQIAEITMHPQIRAEGVSQRRKPCHTPLPSSARVNQAVAIMHQHLEDPLSCEQLALLCSLSTRQLERLFRKHIGLTPQHYYLKIRLERARNLLMNTNLPVLDVALACGFASSSHLDRRFRALFGRSPSEERKLHLQFIDNGHHGHHGRYPHGKTHHQSPPVSLGL
ncbi:MAG: GlxA family transcriptional regulator [Candidatus Competibacterales bacterium]